MRENVVAAWIFMFSFYQYYKNIYWSIPAGKTADLLTASYCGGLAQWPGYPGYTLMLKVTSIIIKKQIQNRF